jgi:hypothetical protein
MPSKITLAIPDQPERVMTRMSGIAASERIGDDPRATRQTLRSSLSAEDAVRRLNEAGDFGLAQLPLEGGSEEHTYVNRLYVVLVQDVAAAAPEGESA